MSDVIEKPEVKMKDLKSDDPRWCAGCGDYSILVGLRKFLVNRQLDPASVVNISGIGCSGRIPHYMNTYGFHTIHGRAVPIAMGVALAKPELKVFIHSGDGDSLSIGGNHLMHGIKKNFNCVYLLFDNQIYGLTKNQTSPTSRKGLKTESQPTGSFLDPINPVMFAMSLGASFVASTAEWLGSHFLETVERAYDHHGFSFIHVAQRCPKYNPAAWNYKESNWITFLTHEDGVSVEDAKAKDAKRIEHSPYDFQGALDHAQHVPDVFGVFYQEEKPCYDDELLAANAKAVSLDRSALLDPYRIS